MEKTATERKMENILAYLIPSLMSSLLPFVTFPIITRFLSPKDFGITALVAGATSMIVSLFTCNVDTAAQRYYFEYRRDANDLCKLINTSLLFLISAMVVSVPLVYFLSGFISKVVMGSSEYKFAIFVSCVNSWLCGLVNFYLILYRNMEKARAFSFFMTSQMVIGTMLSLILIVFFKFTYMGLIYATFLSSLTVFVVLFIRFMTNFPFCYDKKMMLDNLKFGIPLLPNLLTGSISQFLDKYLLGNIVSLGSVGIFSVAQNISNKLFVFMTAVQGTYDPIFMKGIFDREGEGAVSVGRNFTVFTYISLSVVLAAIIFGEEIIYILAPSGYYGTINVFIIILVGISTQTFGKIVGSQFIYAKKAYLMFPLTVLCLIGNVGLNLLLIPRWEAEGAALASTFTAIFMNYLFVFLAQKYYKIIYEKKTLFYIYLNLLISSIFLLYLRSIEFAFYIKYGVKLFSLFVYILIGIKANIITKEKLSIIINVLTFNKTGTCTSK